jgi:hypothetical protein
MVGKRLLDLQRVMAEHEGWIYDRPETKDKNEESLAFRNNNPGNLRSSPFQIGQRNGFAYFYNEEVGKMAHVWDLYKKCIGETSTGLNGESTLKDLIYKYAPPSENDSERYLQVVEARTGLDRGIKLKELLAS